jgi:hypothetical protein
VQFVGIRVGESILAHVFGGHVYYPIWVHSKVQNFTKMNLMKKVWSLFGSFVDQRFKQLLHSIHINSDVLICQITASVKLKLKAKSFSEIYGYGIFLQKYICSWFEWKSEHKYLARL